MVTVTDSVTLGNLIVFLGVVTSLASIWAMFRKTRRENEADADRRAAEIKAAHRADADRIELAGRERSDEIKTQLGEMRVSLGERIKAVETSIADFMPRAEIESKMDHEKNNRVHADEIAARMLGKHSDEIAAIRVDVGRLTESRSSVQSEMAEMKGMLKELSRDMGARMDRIAESMAHSANSQ